MAKNPLPPEHLPFAGIGRALPAALRTRVFEPAYYDLLAAHLADHSHSDATRTQTVLGFHVFVLWIECLVVGGPMLLWALQRRSRRARLAIGVVVLLIIVLLAIALGSTGRPPDYTPTGP